VDIFTMFNDELNAVKKELTQKTVPLPPQHPKFSGQAHWAKNLKKRIERSMMVSTSYCPFLSQPSVGFKGCGIHKAEFF
jgi:hypothetical protein